MKIKIIYLGLVLSLISLVSCNQTPIESRDGFIEASIYYYDSIGNDTIGIQTELYKSTKVRKVDNVPVTTLSSKEISITYYTDKLDYTNRKDKTSVSYQNSNGDYISIGEDMNTSIIIGKNTYSCISIFYKPKR